MHFERTNAPFTVDSVDMEKLTLTSFSGNDMLTTGPGVTLPMNIDAGPGDDNITTGDGPDLIHGDRGNDTDERRRRRRHASSGTTATATTS